MKAFRASGTFRSGKRDQTFSVDIVATNQEDALERVMSNFGSKHRVRRRFVLVDEISEIDPSESSSPSVVAHFGKSTNIVNKPNNSEEE